MLFCPYTTTAPLTTFTFHEANTLQNYIKYYQYHLKPNHGAFRPTTYFQHLYNNNTHQHHVLKIEQQKISNSQESVPSQSKYQLPTTNINTSFSQIQIQAPQNTNIQKHQKYSKKITKQKNNYVQNTKRNFFSNIARLIVNFVSLEEKSCLYLKKIEPDISNQDQNQYYKSMKRLKRQICTYIKKSTFFNLFGFQICQFSSNNQVLKMKNINGVSQNDKKAKQIARKLAFYYIKQELPSIILRSRRMKSQNRLEHLKLRRQLIQSFQSIMSSNQVQKKNKKI